MADLFEKKVSAIIPVNTARGTSRQLSQTFSDALPTDVSSATIYCPQDHRQTDRELARYVNASHRDFLSTKHLSIAGPDSTKVGTDFGVTMGALLNPVSGKVCVALPQVSFPFVRMVVYRVDGKWASW